MLGLAFGSFVNALVWRLHQQMGPQRPSKAAQRQLSILKGHSMCPHCRHRLAARDLVPVFSWLWLKGRCRYCHKPISWQYPLVEAVTAILFGVSYLCWPDPWSGLTVFQFGCWLILLTGFVALAVYDTTWMLLPNRIIYPLLLVAMLLVGVSAAAQKDWGVLLGALLGVLCLGGLFGLIYAVSRGKWIGFGDVRLGVVLGLVVGGALPALLVLFVASLLGTLYAVPLLLAGHSRLSRRVPFGPFLLAATVLVVLFGDGLISWYSNLLLPS